MVRYLHWSHSSSYLTILKTARNQRDHAKKRKDHLSVLETDNSFMKAAEKALSDSFPIGIESSNDELKNAFFFFVKSVLNYVAQKRSTGQQRQQKGRVKGSVFIFRGLNVS